MRHDFFALTLCLTSLTAGCTTTGTFDPDALAALALSTRTDLAALGGTTTTPTSGNASYEGYATTIVKTALTDQVGRQLFGDAELSASFTAAGGSIDGSITNIFAKADVNQTELLTALVTGDAAALATLLGTYDQTSGSVTIENGTISGDTFTADVSGTITHSGTAIAFGGDGSGSFTGSDAAGLSFFAETNEGLTLTEDGTTMAGDLAVFAVKQ